MGKLMGSIDVMVLAACVSIILLQGVSVAVAQTCGKQANNAVCANNLCCSQYGYCGSASAWCGTGCQSGPCTSNASPPPPAAPSSSGGLSSILSRSMFETFFPNRNSFYTYDAFTAAASAYSAFATTGDDAAKKREVAAFCAHVKQETTGLVYIEEINDKSAHCQASTTYPCASGKLYYGRGPLQISWNYNYGAASASVGSDILSNPDLVATDATISFKSALWFWTTASSPKPSCHDVMVGNWSPSSSDTAAGRTAGFGVTIDIINGGVECGTGTASAGATNRVAYYKDFCSQLGVDPGQNLDCTNMQHF